MNTPVSTPRRPSSPSTPQRHPHAHASTPSGRRTAKSPSPPPAPRAGRLERGASYYADAGTFHSLTDQAPAKLVNPLTEVMHDATTANMTDRSGRSMHSFPLPAFAAKLSTFFRLFYNDCAARSEHKCNNLIHKLRRQPPEDLTKAVAKLRGDRGTYTHFLHHLANDIGRMQRPRDDPATERTYGVLAAICGVVGTSLTSFLHMVAGTSPTGRAFANHMLSFRQKQQLQMAKRPGQHAHSTAAAAHDVIASHVLKHTQASDPASKVMQFI